MATRRWNHNLRYHHIGLNEVGTSATRALDIGTGDGSMAARLREQVPEVTAIDLDPNVLVSARQHVGGVTWILGDVATYDFTTTFDVVASIAVLHHLPDVAAALRRCAQLTAPGGVVVVVGLARSTTVCDFLYDIVGAVQHAVLRRRHGYWEHPARKAQPTDSYATVRRVAMAELAGARWKRLPLYRYSLVWRRPGDERMQGG